MYENETVNGLLSYDIYTYNDKNQLEKIMKYHANLYAGFINLENNMYTYNNNGYKRKMQIEYPQIHQTDSILYFYNKNRLLEREMKYDGFLNIVITYIKYEYNNHGELIKETDYSGEDGTPIRISKHSYQNGVNVKTEIFNCSNDEKIRDIRRIYDKNKNLIYVESKELSIHSSMSPYSLMKYEYYQ